MNCPSCGKNFDTERAVKIHHKSYHGESIAKESAICQVVDCSNSFEYYPSEKEGTICPKCIQNGKNIHNTEKVSLDEIRENSVKHLSVRCKNCGADDDIPPHRMPESGNYVCCRSCLDEYNSERMSGTNNPRYVDGNSTGRKYNAEWRNIRMEVLIRDDNSCVICDAEENIHGHHIIPVRSFEDESDAHYTKNAVTLCASCHRNVEYGNIEEPFEDVPYELENHRTENFKYLHE